MLFAGHCGKARCSEDPTSGFAQVTRLCCVHLESVKCTHTRALEALKSLRTTALGLPKCEHFHPAPNAPDLTNYLKAFIISVSIFAPIVLIVNIFTQK